MNAYQRDLQAIHEKIKASNQEGALLEVIEVADRMATYMELIEVELQDLKAHLRHAGDG